MSLLDAVVHERREEVPELLETAACAGRFFNLWWYPTAPADLAGVSTAGVVTALLVATDGGPYAVRAGFVKVAWSDPLLDREMFPTIADWVEHVHGWPCGETQEQQWAALHRFAGRTPASVAGSGVWPWSLSAAMAPSGHVLAVELESITSVLDVEREARLAAFATPTVVESHVTPGVRRHGLATAMYVAAARQVGRQGNVLCASDVQSCAARALWVSFNRNPTIRTWHAVADGGDGRRWVTGLDYRNCG